MQVLFEVGSLLGIVLLVSLLMQWMRLPLLLGYLISGFLLGPTVFGLLSPDTALDLFSQLGVAMLLFMIGLGLHPAVIREVGKASLIAGFGQVILTALVGFGLTRFLGYDVKTSWFLALGFTFSSTIIVMKLLADREDLTKLYGKISIGMLLVQDVVATILLVLVTGISSQTNTGDAFARLFGTLFALLAVLVLFSEWILPRLTKAFAASQEFLLVFIVGWGIGLSVLFAKLGLSVEIGALAAGAALASSSYRHEITAKAKSLRDFFLIFFFVLLGAHLNISAVHDLWGQALFFSLFVLVGNPLIVWSIMGYLGYTKRTTFMTGLSVAQVSEFSLLLLLLATKYHGISESALSLMTLVAVFTILGCTLLFRQADDFYRVLGGLLQFFERSHPFKELRKRERYDAFLFGCHRVGADFLQTLRKRKLSFLVVDFDPQVIDRLERQGIPSRYGDAYDNELMEEVDLAHAKLLVCTVPDQETNLYLLEKARKANKALTCIMTAHSIPDARQLYREGASYVIMPHFIGGNHAALLVEKHGHSRLKFGQERKQHLKHLEDRLLELDR